MTGVWTFITTLVDKYYDLQKCRMLREGNTAGLDRQTWRTGSPSGPENRIRSVIGGVNRKGHGGHFYLALLLTGDGVHSEGNGIYTWHSFWQEMESTVKGMVSIPGTPSGRRWSPQWREWYLYLALFLAGDGVHSEGDGGHHILKGLITDGAALYVAAYLRVVGICRTCPRSKSAD